MVSIYEDVSGSQYTVDFSMAYRVVVYQGSESMGNAALAIGAEPRCPTDRSSQSGHASQRRISEGAQTSADG